MGHKDQSFYHKQLPKMNQVSKLVPLMLLVFTLAAVCSAEAERLGKGDAEVKESEMGRMLEQGRTLVRNTFKRFAILLPAIFFKMGIAFTMLVLVTIVSVNNGFIGFLLLVVGLSSVLARLQEARRPAAAPAVAPYYSPPLYNNPIVPIALRRHYRHDWDRSDVRSSDDSTTLSSYGQQYVYSYDPATYAQTKQT